MGHQRRGKNATLCDYSQTQINTSEKNIFYFLQAVKFGGKWPMTNIFLCWRQQQGSDRHVGKQTIRLCIFNSPTGTHHFSGCHWGCVWHLNCFGGFDSPGSVERMFCFEGKEHKHMTRSSDQLLRDPDLQSSATQLLCNGNAIPRHEIRKAKCTSRFQED